MKQLKTDIAIVAGGTAGIAAAISAAENGAKVTILEKSTHTGGAGNVASGPFAVESRLQFFRMYTLSKEEAFNLHMQYTQWRVNARLVSEYYNKSADTIDWLEKMGVEFREINAHSTGSYYTFHIVKDPQKEGGSWFGSGAHMMKIITDKAKKLGVDILLKTPVKKVIMDGNCAAGVIAENDEGEEIQVNARAVIIATGGFSDNPEWIKKYTGYEPEDVGRIKGMTGDGIRMAWEVGAAPTKMTIQLNVGPKADIRTTKAPKSSWPFSPLFYAVLAANLKVNLLGERFINEQELNPGFIANAIAQQKNKISFSIFDEDTKNHYIQEDIDLPGSHYNKATSLSDDIAEAIESGSDGIAVADSLKDLAGKTGINTDGLQRTILEYNNACDKRVDEIFHKDAKFLRPVKRPKFYALKMGVGAYGTLGGIKINHRTEVLTKNDDIISGLYAAGNDANTIYADTYIYPLPGNTLGFALNSGRIAGENASNYIHK